MEDYAMALKFAKQTDEGRTHGERGDYCRSVGRLSEAIKHYEKYLFIAKRDGDKGGEGSAYNKLGICYNSLGQCDKAIKHHDRALGIAKQFRLVVVEGNCYCNIANCMKSRGQYDKAIKLLKKSLNIGEESEDEETKANAFANLGDCYELLGQYQEAIRNNKMARIIMKQLGNKRGEGSVILNLAGCYNSLGQYDEAVKLYQQALTIMEQVGNKLEEGGAHANLALCYHSLGHFNEAMKSIEMAKNFVIKKTESKNDEAAVYSTLGVCFEAFGEFDEAIKHHQMALNIVKQVGYIADEAAVYADLGNVYRNLGQITEAIEYYKMTLDIAKQTGDKAREEGAYGNLGVSYGMLRQDREAIKYNEKALEIAQEIRDLPGEGKCHINLGISYCSLGQFDEAAKHIKRGLDIAKRTGDSSAEAKSYGSLGIYYSHLEQFDQAVENTVKAQGIAKQIRDKKDEGSLSRNLGCIYYCLGQYGKAECCLRESARCMEEQFKSAPKEDHFKVSFLDTFSVVYRLLLQTLLLQGKTEEALVVAERGRAKALAGLMFSGKHDRSARVPKVLSVGEIREVVQALGSAVVFFSSVPGVCAWIVEPNGEIKLSPCLMPEISSQVKTCDPDRFFASYIEDQIALISITRELLRSRCTVRCEDRSMSFLYPDKMTGLTLEEPSLTLVSSTTTPADTTVAEPGASQHGSPSPPIKEMSMATISAGLDETENPNQREESRGSTLESALKQLYQLTMGPVQQFVDGSQVVVVPDGPLALIPFAALVDEEGRYVAETLQVRLVPSLATAKMIAEYPPEPEDQGIALVVGDPEVGEVTVDERKVPVPRLPHANKEAEVIGEMLKVQPLTAKRATKEVFLQKVDSASVIHVAAHGDMKRGEILLAPNPDIPKNDIKKEDVMLTISDLERKRLRAKLVVLSSCHSGRGEVRAEGVIGIARAFLGAGARAVLVTLWGVDDKATLFFMEKFYENLVGGEKTSMSLHKAMKTMRETEEFSDPYFWAPFVLIGEDATPFPLRIYEDCVLP